jgi:LacI family transcriptional regulator
MPPRLPTTREIAAAVGVHQTTVSLALRNHPRIPLPTRLKIRKVAEKLGYRQDPRITELMYHLRLRRTQNKAEAIGYISDAKTRHSWHPHGTYFDQLEGARHRATQLGYRLEEFWLNQSGLTANRLDRILRARNIRGIIIGPISDERYLDGLTWERYAVAGLNYSPRTLSLHRVCSNHARSLDRVLEALAQRGFTRFGLVQSHEQDRRVRHLWTSAYHGFCARHSEVSFVPVCFADHESDEPAANRETLLKWFTTHRPQVLLTTARQWRDVLSAVSFSTPQDYSFVLLDRHRDADSARFAGIDQRHPEIGAIATSKIADLLTRGEFGLPDFESATMVEGTLVTGATLRVPVGGKIITMSGCSPT